MMMRRAGAIALAGAALAIGAPAQATSVAPKITVNGAAFTGQTLTIGNLYTFQVNLKPAATAIFGYSFPSPGRSCGTEHVSSPEYCVTDVFSHLVGTPVISGATLNGYDLSDADTISGDTLSFLDGSYIPDSHVINFTETFSEARSVSSYFYGNKNPSDDGYSTTAYKYDLKIPTGFNGSPLACGFTGSISYGATLNTSRFNTVANCSLTLNYAFPVAPPPPPSIPGVPEPATWLMMVTGFGVIGAAMRRSAARSARSAALA